MHAGRREKRRRYAGVSHIDVDRVLEDDAYAKHILDYSKEKNVDISSLAYLSEHNGRRSGKESGSSCASEKCNPCKRKAGRRHGDNIYRKRVDKDSGRESGTGERSIASIIKLAEENDVKVAIENCPDVVRTGSVARRTEPDDNTKIWREVFKILDSDNLGINYDPSHFVWQMIDYIKPIYEFKDKIFHVHYKDIKVYRDRLNDCGIMAYPL